MLRKVEHVGIQVRVQCAVAKWNVAGHVSGIEAVTRTAQKISSLGANAFIMAIFAIPPAAHA